MKQKYLLALFCIINLVAFSQSEITIPELKNHITFLTSVENSGRLPGGKENRRVVRYIKKQLKKNHIRPIKNNYIQKFKATLRVKKSILKKPKVKTWNVIGFIEGNDVNLKEEFIVLGAHYDHLGHGGPSSKSDKVNTIHPGADDNASGTSALLEIAEKLASNRDRLNRSILFIAFGAEEQGLLGSRYFVENSPILLSKIKLMINLDMVGRLNTENHVYMGGAGTFPNGVNFMKELGESLGLTPIVHAGSVGGSDHVSFYRKDISVLGMHTGGHPQYHTPEDTIDLINFEGQKKVCEYVYETIFRLASSNYSLKFINQD